MGRRYVVIKQTVSEPKVVKIFDSPSTACVQANVIFQTSKADVFVAEEIYKPGESDLDDVVYIGVSGSADLTDCQFVKEGLLNVINQLGRTRDSVVVVTHRNKGTGRCTLEACKELGIDVLLLHLKSRADKDVDSIFELFIRLVRNSDVVAVFKTKPSITLPVEEIAEEWCRELFIFVKEVEDGV